VLLGPTSERAQPSARSFGTGALHKSLCHREDQGIQVLLSFCVDTGRLRRYSTGRFGGGCISVGATSIYDDLGGGEK